MAPDGIAVLVAAGAQALTVLLGLGRVQQAIKDVRDDMRETRMSIQSCLQALILAGHPANPEPSSRKEQPCPNPSSPTPPQPG